MMRFCKVFSKFGDKLFEGEIRKMHPGVNPIKGIFLKEDLIRSEFLLPDIPSIKIKLMHVII